MQVLVNSGGFRPIHTTLPSTRFPTTHQAARVARSKTPRRVAASQPNRQKESFQMATATYLPMRSTHRTPAQKAETKRMLAGLKASRRSNTVTLEGLDRLPMGTWAKSKGKVVKGGKFVHTGTKTQAYKGTVKIAKSGKPVFVHTRKTAKKSGGSTGGTRKKLFGAAKAMHDWKKAGSKGKPPYRENSPRRSNSGGKFVSAPKTKFKTREVLITHTKHARNPVGFDHADNLLRLGTWGKVGIGVLLGLGGLLVSFGVPKGLAVVTGMDAFQRGWGGVATATVASLGAGLLLGLLSKKASLGLLTAAGVGVALLALGAALGKTSQIVIPINEAILASMLPTYGVKAPAPAPAPAPAVTTQAPLYNMPGVGPTTMSAQQAAAMGLQPIGMGAISYYPAAPGMGYYPAQTKPSYYPAGSAGYNAPTQGSVSTPNAQVYERAAGQTSGPQGYNAPVSGAVNSADQNVRYSATTKEKF